MNTYLPIEGIEIAEGDEIVVFKSEQVLPRFIVHYTVTVSLFLIPFLIFDYKYKNLPKSSETQPADSPPVEPQLTAPPQKAAPPPTDPQPTAPQSQPTAPPQKAAPFGKPPGAKKRLL